MTALRMAVKLGRTPRSQVDEVALFPRLLRFDHGNRFDRFTMWAACVLMALGGALFIVAGSYGVDLNWP